jgi:eukaryotic-like serine/threonine-protein kinase
MSPSIANRRRDPVSEVRFLDRCRPFRFSSLAVALISISWIGCSSGSPSPGPVTGSSTASQAGSTASTSKAVDQTGLFPRRSRRTEAAKVADAGLQKAAPTPAAVDEKPVIVVPSPVGPESWATFRNGNNQLGIAKTTLPEKPEELWQFATSDGMVACAAIVGDQVYVPCLNGQLVSVDRKTGKQQWSYRSIESKNPNDFAPGFKAAPTVTNELVYIGDEDGMMHAIDRRTGKAKWTFRTGAEIAGSVALFGDKLVFGSHDSFLYCLKASDHTPVWKPFQTENFINCSTAIEADNTFIAGCDTKVRVINLISGKELSEVPLGEGAYLIASPAVRGDVLYVGTHDGRVVAVDWRKQKVVWTYADENHLLEYRSSAAVTDKYVILGGYDKELHCLDRQNGKQVWSFKTRAKIESSPVIVGDRIFFGSGDGNVYAVTMNGKPAWKERLGRSITASPAVGEHCLVIGTDVSGGTVHCFGSKGS